MIPNLSRATWRKSARSGGVNNCVEVAGNVPGFVAVRDSKNIDRSALIFDPREWGAFIGGVKTGEFDRR